MQLVSLTILISLFICQANGLKVFASSFKLSAQNTETGFVPSNVGIIGVKYLHKKGDMSTVIDVYPHTPAEAAGVRVGDRVVEVDGTNIMAFDADQVFAMIAGYPGQPVRLKLMRCAGNQGACRAYEVNLVRMDMNELASDNVFKIYKYGN